MLKGKYLRKTSFNKFTTSMNTTAEEREQRGLRMIFGMGPQYVESEQHTQGKQNKRHGRQPGSYKHKRDIVKKSRRANRER